MTPRFGGVGDAVSNLIGTLDSNRMLELMTSDGIGMILPRTALALNCRGTDDARETFLREASGLVGNIFLMGWAGYAVTRMLGDTVNFYNPKGIPGRAWITAPTLNAFGHLYKEELKKVQLPHGSDIGEHIATARSGFINRILEGLESDDRHLSIEGRLSSLEQINKTDQGKVLEKMLESVPVIPNNIESETKKCTALLDQLTQLKGSLHLPQNKKLYAERRQTLRNIFLDAGWGRLSPNGKRSLADAFKQKTGAAIGSQLKGTMPFDDMAHSRVAELQEAFIQANGLESAIKEVSHSPLDQARLLKARGFDSEKEFIKQRLTLSLSDLRRDASAFQKVVDKDALLHGLTGTVDFRYQKEGKEIKLSANRGTMVKELKHFLEQFVDRAADSAHKAADSKENWGHIQKRIADNLSAKSESGFLHKLMPKAEDGLITASIKSKGAYTWIPLAFCIAAAGAFTFYNNYLTMKKHSGRIFFPGEGIPPVEGTLKPSMMNSAKGLQTPGATGVYHNFGNFPNYPEFRNAQGGIIA